MLSRPPAPPAPRTAARAITGSSLGLHQTGDPLRHTGPGGDALSDPPGFELRGDGRDHQASRFQADDDLVFPHPVLGSVLDSSAMRKRFKRALARAGLREVRFHDLRHSFGTAMAATGVPMRAIQAWMGHASITTTEIYADYSPDPSGGAEWVRRAFDQDPRGTDRGTNLTETQVTSAN